MTRSSGLIDHSTPEKERIVKALLIAMSAKESVVAVNARVSSAIRWSGFASPGDSRFHWPYSRRRRARSQIHVKSRPSRSSAKRARTATIVDPAKTASVSSACQTNAAVCLSAMADIKFLLTKLFATLRPFTPMRSTRIVANISFALQPTSDRAKVRMAAASRVATARLGVPRGLHASPRRLAGGLTTSLPDPAGGMHWALFHVSKRSRP
jgi:hypothetical protein